MSGAPKTRTENLFKKTKEPLLVSVIFIVSKGYPDKTEPTIAVQHIKKRLQSVRVNKKKNIRRNNYFRKTFKS